MNLRCRVGDLARTVHAVEPNADKFVTCLEYVGVPPLLCGLVSEHTDCWRIDRTLTWCSNVGAPMEFPYCPDSLLRPIRGTDAPDEVLEIVGLPETVTA